MSNLSELVRLRAEVTEIRKAAADLAVFITGDPDVAEFWSVRRNHSQVATLPSRRNRRSRRCKRPDLEERPLMAVPYFIGHGTIHFPPQPNWWRFKSLTVVIERKASGILQARVRQQNAEGQVYGKNLLSKASFTRIDSAKKRVREILYAKTEVINFEEVQGTQAPN